jgi:hypothetical protein
MSGGGGVAAEGEALSSDFDRWQGLAEARMSAKPPVLTSRVGRILRLSRRIGVAVAGGSALLLGTAFLFLPAPGVLVISLALALLATEFRWARSLLGYLRARAAWAVKRLQSASAGG